MSAKKVVSSPNPKEESDRIKKREYRQPSITEYGTLNMITQSAPGIIAQDAASSPFT
jgi:hypothetical protein